MRYYFAYGMNTNLEHMARRCPGAVYIGPAHLRNYELVFKTHADIERRDGSGMWGVLWNITEDCERSLDFVEGFPFYYIKQEYVVQPKNNKPQENIIAMVYKMTPNHNYALPHEHYQQCLLEGYTSAGINIDQITKALDGLKTSSQTI